MMVTFLESAGYKGGMEVVQQTPQNVGLANERGDAAHLTVMGYGMGDNKREGLISIVRSP
jgi:hypothetical protein